MSTAREVGRELGKSGEHVATYELSCVAKILTVLSDHASKKSVIKRLDEKQQLQLVIGVN
jgi:hypothetical protein